MSEREFKLVEDHGDWVEQWVCDPPVEGARYQVLLEEWNADETVRTIFEVKVADVSPGGE